MKFRRSLLLLLPVMLCQCQSDRTVVDKGISASGLGGSGIGGGSDMEKAEAIRNKFAGNWKPEDASWYSAPGETDKKKIAENQKSVHRSKFEQVVTKSREEALFSKSTKWQERTVYHKEFGKGEDKKTFSWPWQKKTAATKLNNMVRTNEAQERVSADASRTARESTATARDGSTEFATRDFNSRTPDVQKRAFWKTEQASSHRTPDIIEDRSESSKDEGWSVSDVRKLLNKN